MKKIIISIFFILVAVTAWSQNLKGYQVEALQMLKAKRAFVIGGDTLFSTTQTSGIDTTFVTLEYLRDSLKITEGQIIDFGDYEPAFDKNSGFNKDFGTTTGTVLQGRTFGSAANNNTSDFESPLTFSTGLSRTGNTISNTITQYTDALARGAISLTTNNTSGAAEYNSSTGVLNIPNYEVGTGGTSLSGNGYVFMTGTTPSYDNTVFNSSNANLNTVNWTVKDATTQYHAINKGQLDAKIAGTTNYITKYTGTNTIGNSQIFDNGSRVLVGTVTDNGVDKLQVNGSILGTTAKLTNLTDNFYPFHKSDALGLVDGNVKDVSGIMQYSTAKTFTNARDIVDKGYVDNSKLPSDWEATTGVTRILNKPTLFSGSYVDLTNKPTIPTDNNQLTNGAGYITAAEVTTPTLQSVTDAGAITTKAITALNVTISGTPINANHAVRITDLSNALTDYYTKTQVNGLPVSTFSNNAGYLTTETDPIFTAWDKDYNDLINKPAPIVVAGDSINAHVAGAINGTNNNFTTHANFIAGTTMVYVNGVRQEKGFHYNEGGTTQINFISPYTPKIDERIIIDYKF